MESSANVRLHKRLYRKARRDKLPRLIEKYGDKCFWCECHLALEAITVDHYIPLSLGGSNKTDNLRLACYGCNQKRGNAMPEETPEIIAERSKISFLSHWKSPKYSLGQQMKQGQIVGIEYHPAGTFRASRFGERWTYWVLIHDHDIDVESFQEQSLEPMSEEDLLLEIESIKANVTSQEKNLSALVEQLREDG